MHGQGTYTYADGQQYTGEFDRNLKSGFGSHKYVSGDQVSIPLKLESC